MSFRWGWSPRLRSTGRTPWSSRSGEPPLPGSSRPRLAAPSRWRPAGSEVPDRSCLGSGGCGDSFPTAAASGGAVPARAPCKHSACRVFQSARRPQPNGGRVDAGGRLLTPGTLVGNDFHVVRLLSEGGMAVAYVAEQVSLRETRALKVRRRIVAADGDRLRCAADPTAEFTDPGRTSSPDPRGLCRHPSPMEDS